MRVEEMQKIMGEYEKYKNKLNQIEASIANKVANKDNLNIELIKK